MEENHFPIRTLGDADFPPLLREIADPPKRLYARGTIRKEGNRVLAVVGSRTASSYGIRTTKALIEGLRDYPVSIISGLAIGIDSVAHEAALEAGLHTVGVPGSGISDQVLYPVRNRALATAILKSGGGLLGELEPTAHPQAWTFPARNRIMAGLSDAVLIIEAKEKSGTLITARLAMEYNREVLAVPGDIFAAGSYGPHMLIENGATPITTAKDILQALKIST